MNTDWITKEMLNRCANRLSLEGARVLYETFSEIKPKAILEIGAAQGCSSMVLAQVAKENNGILYSVEAKPVGRWAENIARLGLQHHVVQIVGKSPWIEPSRFPESLDGLFLDGEHRTRWVLVDYHHFSRFVRSGGLIVFHDWTGAGGYKFHIQRAVNIILEDDELIEVARVERNDKGLIVFEKP